MHAPILIALGWLVLAPEPVAAWGPATHVALGKVVLGSLYLVPPALRALLALYPREFLYGSIAADISFAKKYVPEGRHCHNWSVGEEILGELGANDGIYVPHDTRYWFESVDDEPLQILRVSQMIPAE